MAIELTAPFLTSLGVKLMKFKLDNSPYWTHILVYSDPGFTQTVYKQDVGMDTSPKALRSALIKLFKQFVEELEKKEVGEREPEPERTEQS